MCGTDIPFFAGGNTGPSYPLAPGARVYEYIGGQLKARSISSAPAIGWSPSRRMSSGWPSSSSPRHQRPPGCHPSSRRALRTASIQPLSAVMNTGDRLGNVEGRGFTCRAQATILNPQILGHDAAPGHLARHLGVMCGTWRGTWRGLSWHMCHAPLWHLARHLARHMGRREKPPPDLAGGLGREGLRGLVTSACLQGSAANGGKPQGRRPGRSWAAPGNLILLIMARRSRPSCAGLPPAFTTAPSRAGRHLQPVRRAAHGDWTLTLVEYGGSAA